MWQILAHVQMTLVSSADHRPLRQEVRLSLFRAILCPLRSPEATAPIRESAAAIPIEEKRTALEAFPPASVENSPDCYVHFPVAFRSDLGNTARENPDLFRHSTENWLCAD